MNQDFHLLETTTDVEFQSAGVALMEKAVREAIDARGRAIVGLSGGSTPRPIYEALGQLTTIDWMKVWIFLVDDRYVPADNPHSNQALLRSTLLKHAPIPESQLLFPDTTLPLDECISLYEEHLTDLLKKGAPDIVTLGMGNDGHIASLFPPLGADAFGPELVIHTQTEKFTVKERISVTLPVLQKARKPIFFLKGKEKKNVWEKMMASAEDEYRWPAKAVIGSTAVTALGQW